MSKAANIVEDMFPETREKIPSIFHLSPAQSGGVYST